MSLTWIGGKRPITPEVTKKDYSILPTFLPSIFQLAESPIEIVRSGEDFVSRSEENLFILPEILDMAIL